MRSVIPVVCSVIPAKAGIQPRLLPDQTMNFLEGGTKLGSFAMSADLLNQKIILACAFIGLWILIVPPIWGCTTPVFRYALERWPADLYEVILFHRGTLNVEEQDLLENLQNDPGANILVKACDVSEESDQEMLRLWESQSASELPWIVLLYPRFLQIGEPVWAAHFTASAVETLLHSPVRTTVANRILQGDSAVWILVESGAKEQDEAAAHLLDTQLIHMEETLEIPEQADYPDYYAANTDLEVAFSVIRVAHADTKEQALIQMLCRGDPELLSGSKPMAFPIFGRGRALCALVGASIDQRNIEDICSFLIGQCSCQVKEMNPGMDLLISVDWDGMMAQQMEEYAQTPLFDSPAEETTANIQSSGILRRNILLVVFVQLAVVVIAACVVLWRKKRGEA